MTLLFLSGTGANDAITAILAVAIAAVLRGMWTLQQRIARLEGLDEMRERHLHKDRDEEDTQP